MRGSQAAICVGMVMTLLGAAPVAAHTWTTVDADDSAGPLDIVYARLRHPKAAAETTVKVVTYETWDEGVLERPTGGERNFIGVEVDTRGDSGPERRIIVTTQNGELVASMYGPGWGDPLEPPRATVEVRRPDEHSVAVTFPTRMLGRGTDSYRWAAVTSFEATDDASCPKPEGPYDGGYGECADFTAVNEERR